MVDCSAGCGLHYKPCSNEGCRQADAAVAEDSGLCKKRNCCFVDLGTTLLSMLLAACIKSLATRIQEASARIPPFYARHLFLCTINDCVPELCSILFVFD